MSWGRAMRNLDRFFRTLIAILFTLIMFISVSVFSSCTTKKQLSIEVEELCIDNYHENFYLEDYDYWLCLTCDPICRTDTFYIGE
tara:strand:+ start:1902 stop:2156 length:255 start_codon:yes stop_codon:yes gene_type:complete